MANVIILVVLILYAIWRYYLMGRLDKFLNTSVKFEEEENTDTEHSGK